MLSIILAISASPLQNQIGHLLNRPIALTAKARQQSQLTIEEAVRLALANNPRIKALAFELAAAEHGVSSASALANPSITFTPGLTRSGSDEELLISQPLEISGTRSARMGVAKAQRRIVEAEALTELREIVYALKTAYLDLARAQERLSLVVDLAKHAAELDAIAQRQVELGNRAGIDRTQTSIEATRAKQQATLAKAEYESALATLNTELGRGVAEPIAVTNLKIEGTLALDEVALLGKALEFRADIALSRAKQEEFRMEARLTRAEGLPDVAPQYRLDSLTRTPRDGGFGIGISIPIIDYGRLRNRIRQSEASQKAEEQRLAAIQNKVRQEVTQAVARLRAAIDVLKSFEDGMLTDARKLLDTTRAGFALGETSLITVLDAQRTYRSVQAEYIEALASYGQALAQLERATGGVPSSLLREISRPEVSKK